MKLSLLFCFPEKVCLESWVWVHYLSSAKMLFKRYFSIPCGSKDKTKSCWLCVVLLLQAAVPSVCFRVWHLPLGRKNWHVSPFIADWFHCTGGLCFMASWFQSSSWLAKANVIKRYFSLWYLLFSFSCMILTWKNISKQRTRAKLGDSFSHLGLVVKISHNVWLHLYELTLTYFINLKNTLLWLYVYI